MYQSLPGIVSIHTVECSRLQPQLMLRAMSKLPNAVFAPLTHRNHIGEPICNTISEYLNGSRSEKTTLEFISDADFDTSQPLAFVVKCVNGDSFLIGRKEHPYPTVTITHTTGTATSESSSYRIEVNFLAPKTLIPIKF